MDKSKVLVVTEDGVFFDHLEKQAAKIFKLIRVTDGEVLKKVFNEVPHVLLIDEAFSGGRGSETAQVLKEDALLKCIPLILIGDRVPKQDSPSSPSIFFFEKKRGTVAELIQLVDRALAHSDNELDLNPLKIGRAHV